MTKDEKRVIITEINVRCSMYEYCVACPMRNTGKCVFLMEDSGREATDMDLIYQQAFLRGYQAGMEG